MKKNLLPKALKERKILTMWYKSVVYAICLIAAGILTYNGYAQNVGISATGTPPDNSAMLDVDVTGMNPKKGLLIPRMTTAERNAVPSPANSLLIFNTTTQCFEYYITSTTTWYTLGCACMPPSSAPTANAASGVASNSFVANWSSVSGATCYQLDVATDAGFTSFVPGYNNLNVGNVTSYNVTGLTCGTTYYYRVRACNSCGSTANSNVITAATNACCPASYAVSSIPYAPLSPPGSTNPGPSGDDLEGGPYPIGFNFCFYGTTYSQFYISTNGFIDFPGGQGPGCCNGVTIPNTATPNGIIAACWTDLNTNSGGNIDYFVVGTAPNRQLVVRFNNVAEYGNTGYYYNGQIILYETTNVIEIHSGRYYINGHTVAVGVENQAGTLGTGAPGYNTIGAPINTSNLAWRFQ